jgi:anhydro-N-acetylmuramic acid kinase
VNKNNFFDRRRRIVKKYFVLPVNIPVLDVNSQLIMQEYNVLGIMSGTSLDGVDLAHCRFSKGNTNWQFEIGDVTTIEYNQPWKNKLSDLHTKDAVTFANTHAEYGHYLGILVKDFVRKNKLKVDFVSSHGHTIFHQPQHIFTSQIGDGAAISAECGLPVVCDFRTKDVAAGGQGAPLVPIGDKLLFPEFDFCLNLGGIANISFDLQHVRTAFDICPCNMVLNHYAKLLGKEYDDEGKFAAQGKLNIKLFDNLNALPFYTIHSQKSLGRENIENDFFPILDSSDASYQDKLNTFCEHVAFQISAVTTSCKQKTANSKLLITGGGTFNKFLISRIKELSGMEIVIPSETIIKFKEALIFAFLGVLRWREEVNCLKSVTGARTDSVGGAIYV